MGFYVNPPADGFRAILNSKKYVDKTGLIAYMNSVLETPEMLVASTRPRRFGKSFAAKMLAAYYSKDADAGALFENLKIAGMAGSGYEEHLNKHDVLFLDVVSFISMADDIRETVRDIQAEVIEELKEAYPGCVKEGTNSLFKALMQVHAKTGNKFFVIIDEWDALFREAKEDEALQKSYIQFLRSMFKSGQTAQVIIGAYMTGILPIKKYGTQSALTDFKEYTMLEPGPLAPFIGFTEEEVRGLCAANELDFEETQKWYDGYQFDVVVEKKKQGDQEPGIIEKNEQGEQEPGIIEKNEHGDQEPGIIEKNEQGEQKPGCVQVEQRMAVQHVYCPNSIMEFVAKRKYGSYWTRTETYESLRSYIDLNYDGLKDALVGMLGGKRCRINIRTFQNDMTSIKSRDDVFTLLVHLGYLGFDSDKSEVFIPNEEVREEFVTAVREGRRPELAKAVRMSDELLAATLRKDGNTVAALIEAAHFAQTSPRNNNGEQALRHVVIMAYLSSMDHYLRFEEIAGGRGYCDILFLPRNTSSKPALLIELKWDKSVDQAITQIEEKQYPEIRKKFGYGGKLLLIGVNYSTKTGKHTCRIEEYAG